MFRLPDLPNVGYSTQREKLGSDLIMQFMRETERNRERLLSIVIEGREKWRKHAAAAMAAGTSIPDDIYDAMYDYFTIQAAKPRVQRMLLDAKNNPLKWRAIVKALMPHLEREREVVRKMDKWRP